LEEGRRRMEEGSGGALSAEGKAEGRGKRREERKNPGEHPVPIIIDNQ